MGNKTLVLGSGISALAYLFYHREAHALAGKQVGGLFAKAQALGPQYIWKTDSTQKLFEDMRIPYEVERVNIGYHYEGRTWSYQELEQSGKLADAKSKYSMRTRGTLPKASHMSSGQGSFEVIDFPVEKLVEVLIQRVAARLIHTSASRIDTYEHLVSFDSDVYEYDKLVSTIPAPVLLSLCGRAELAKSLVAADKVYVLDRPVHEFERDLNPLGKFDYIYVVDSPKNNDKGGYDFHRVQGKPNPSIQQVVREYTLLPGEEVEVPGTEGLVQKNGQIISGGEVLRSLPPSVKTLGRYAEWRHDSRLENVLDEVIPV